MEPNAVHPTDSLRIAYVPGVVPDKWVRRHRERFPRLRLVAFPDDNPVAALGEGRADMCLAREPLADEQDVADLHRVELYEEVPGVAAEKEHPIGAFAESEVISDADLAGETVLMPALALGEPVDVAAVREMLSVVATGAGIAFAPRPLLRQLSGRKVVHREHAQGAATRIVLLWPRGDDDDVRQDFVGTVRGRTANSARNAQQSAKTAAARGVGVKGRGGAAGVKGRKGEKGVFRGKRNTAGRGRRSGGKTAGRGGRRK